jgi:23S rRNA (adenine2503-C2)-methyltransferase
VSLHAPNHELRQSIVPIERKHPIPELMAALREFEAAGGRRITFEYTMIEGVNDAPALAEELASLIGEFHAHVNLIPYNPIPGPDWRPSPPLRLRRFAEVLTARGIEATVREPRGRDIAAACGQLRAEHATKAPKPYLQLHRGDGSAAGSGAAGS